MNNAQEARRFPRGDQNLLSLMAHIGGVGGVGKEWSGVARTKDQHLCVA